MQIKLSEIRPGQRVMIEDISDGCPVKRRLKEFGLVPGTPVSCRFLSPGRDLAALEIRGAVIAARTRDLRTIAARRLP